MRRVKNEQEHLVKVCMQTNAVQVWEMAKLLRMEKLAFNKKLRRNSLTLKEITTFGNYCGLSVSKTVDLFFPKFRGKGDEEE